MERKAIRVARPGEAGKMLCPMTVGRGSALWLELVGVPDGVSNVQFHAGRPGTENYSTVTASPISDGRWAVYASGLNFPNVGVAKYHVTGKDEKDGSVWLGRGRLNIEQSVVNVDAEDVPLVPEDAYVRNPATGLWHKLTVVVEDGVLVPELDKTGVTR